MEKAAPAILALKPDIAILSEVPSIDRSTLDVCSNSWRGAAGSRHGLAIVGFNGWQIQPELALQPEERFFLPVQAEKERSNLSIVGVCVKRAGNYVDPTLRAIEKLRPCLEGERVIMAGDFNQSRVFDRKRPPKARFERVTNQLDEMGMRSVWHTFSGDDFGRESTPTYFMRWREDSPFHIDYAFVSRGIGVATMHIGAYGDYVATKLSDHTPLLLDLDI